jgi:ketose-bisphosphate aldolase
MPYVSDGRLLIRHAFESRYAMPAFNVCSLEMARACVLAAEAERAPIILQTYPGDLQHAAPAVFAAMVRALADEASIPVMLHLDHGDGLERVAQCLRAGYSSAMFDGEAYPLEENIARTRQLAEFAHAASASLEAAAGSFGGEGDEGNIQLTEPEVAARIRRESGADMVACSVGSKHGQASKLDLARLRAIARAMQGPIVLHGGSGIPAEDLAQAVQLGVVKVNIGAALYRPLLEVWQHEVGQAKWHYDVYAAAREVLCNAAREKIRIMNASAKA